MRYAPALTTAPATALLAATLILAGSAPPALPQPAGTTAPADPAAAAGFAGPREVFEAAKTAFNERRWDNFLDCVTPDQQAAMVGEMVAAFEMMRQAPNADARVAELVGRFFPRGVPAGAVSDDPEVRHAATADLVAQLESPAAFFGAATDLAMAIRHGRDSAEIRVDQLGDLRPVKVGDRASNRAVRAEVTLRLPSIDTPRRDVWTFVVKEKRWFLAPLGLD